MPFHPAVAMANEKIELIRLLAILHLLSSDQLRKAWKKRKLSSPFLPKLWRLIFLERIDRLNWFFAWYHHMTLSTDEWSYTKFQTVQPPKPAYLPKNFKSVQLKKYSMKFSEILHKQPSIPWTNPGEVVRRSRNYFGRDRKKHFSRYQKQEIHGSFFRCLCISTCWHRKYPRMICQVITCLC